MYHPNFSPEFTANDISNLLKKIKSTKMFNNIYEAKISVAIFAAQILEAVKCNETIISFAVFLLLKEK